MEQEGSPAAEFLKRARADTGADADDLWAWLDKVMLTNSPAAEVALTPVREGQKVASYSPVSLFCALADGQVTADKEIPVSVAPGGSWLIVELRVLAPISAAPEDAPSGVGIRWEPPPGVDLMRAEVIPIPSRALWQGAHPQFTCRCHITSAEEYSSRSADGGRRCRCGHVPGDGASHRPTRDATPSRAPIDREVNASK